MSQLVLVGLDCSGVVSGDLEWSWILLGNYHGRYELICQFS